MKKIFLYHLQLPPQFFILLCFCAILASSCRSGKAKDQGRKDYRAMMKKRRRAKPVHGFIIKQGNISSLLSTTTTLKAESEVTVMTQISGLVQRVYGKEGRYFRRGGTLARVSNPYLKIAHDRVLLEVRKLTSDLKRQKKLMSKGYVSRETTETLNFKLAQARNQLKRAKQDLRNLRIKATISGIVTHRYIQQGAWVNPQMKAFMIENPRSLVAHIAAPERYLSRLKKGLKAYLKAEALGIPQTITGEIIRVAPSIDPKSGTIDVMIGKLRPLKILRSGMFVSVRVVLEHRKNVPLIPKGAVSYHQNRASVLRLQAKKGKCLPPAPSACYVEKIFFAKGLENTHWVEAKNKLRAGDSIIILGQQGLRKGHKVRVVQWRKLLL